MPSPRRYPTRKERSVRLVFESGRPIAHVAHGPGINYESLRCRPARPKLKAVGLIS